MKEGTKEDSLEGSIDRERIEAMAVAHRRLMRLFNPATARDWVDDTRKETSYQGNKFVRKETRKIGT